MAHRTRSFVTALIAIAVLAISVLASCGDDAGTVREFRMESLEYTLQPGEEQYYCYTFRLPTDGEHVITAIEPEYGISTHHIFFAQTLAPEPEGWSDCPVLARDTWIPLYLGGVESNRLEMPAGTGVALPPGQQVLMQLHLQNPTPEPITARTTLTLTLAEPGEERTPAGVFGLDNRLVSIPARASAHETVMRCRPERHMEVFAVLGHMHQFGTRMRMERVRGGATEMLFDQVWSFAEQPTTPVAFSLDPGDELVMTCTHANPSESVLGYGESSNDEMCALVMYYTPFDFIDGCIEDGDE